MNIYQAKHWTSSVSIFVCFFSPMQRANDSTNWANGGLTYHSFFPLFLRVKPLHYISWLIGHEGTGSVLSLLRRKWVLLPSIWFVFFCLIRGSFKKPVKRSSIYCEHIHFFMFPAFELQLQSIGFTPWCDWFILFPEWMWLHESCSPSLC